MPPSDYVSTYKAHLAQLINDHGHEHAMQLVVGGQYLEQSELESSAVIALGLQPTHTIVDVGCGSGRLAFGLRNFLTGKFIGTDILHEPLEYARSKCGRSDWDFIHHSQPSIPVPDATADFITFFSVFTHLLDEDVFKFLKDAKRALKPTGKIVFSFLDFECDAHWPLFLKTVEDPNPERVLNKFITKAIVRRWERALGLRLEVLYDGPQPWVPIRQAVLRENGQMLSGTSDFGQSVAVLRKFPEAEYLAAYPDVRDAVAAGLFASGAHHYQVCGFREGRGV
jgi:ubiquinone/menaquinone biosynthesis C-methylase UbiE